MIESIYLKNFRLFSELNLKFKYSTNIICGKNGVGKTSILEGIYLLSTTKSFKDTNLENLIKDNEEYSLVKLNAFAKEYSVLLNDNKKTFTINNKPYKKLKDYIGDFLSVIFSSDDISLIDGSKLEKRRFMDLEISLINKDYLKYISNYKKNLEERNELLKSDNIDKIYLEVLTDNLINDLKYIYKKRIEFLNDLNIRLADITKEINFRPLKLIYEASYDSDNIKKSFSEKLNYDLKTRSTNIGAHRDDFKILINNNDAKIYASFGQKRMIAVIIKLALKKLIEDKNQKDVILLLDDVFAALDKNNVSSLINYIKDSKQIFITTTSVFEIPEELLKNANVIRIEREK